MSEYRVERKDDVVRCWKPDGTEMKVYEHNACDYFLDPISVFGFGNYLSMGSSQLSLTILLDYGILWDALHDYYHEFKSDFIFRQPQEGDHSFCIPVADIDALVQQRRAILQQSAHNARGRHGTGGGYPVARVP